MSALALSVAELSISSLEVAEITGKRHFHVLRDIRDMAEALKIDATKFGFIFSDAYGRPLHGFKLRGREYLILASGYSVELRAKLVDRWIELETAARATPSDARIAALESRVAALEAAPAPAPRLPRKPPATSRILDFIRKRQSVTRSELLRQFREVSARGLDDALAEFQAEGVVVVVSIAPKVGRPSTTCRWVQ